MTVHKIIPALTPTATMRSFYVTGNDGTIQEVRAGCFMLTSNGYWSFYREAKIEKVYDKGVSKTVSTPIHVIDSRKVRGIFDVKHVILEAIIESASKGDINTVIRKRTPKKDPKASKADLKASKEDVATNQ